MADYTYFWKDNRTQTITKRKIVGKIPELLNADMLDLFDDDDHLILFFKFLYHDDKYANTNSINLPTNIIGKNLHLKKVVSEFFDQIKHVPFYFLRNEQNKMGSARHWVCVMMLFLTGIVTLIGYQFFELWGMTCGLFIMIASIVIQFIILDKVGINRFNKKIYERAYWINKVADFYNEERLNTWPISIGVSRYAGIIKIFSDEPKKKKSVNPDEDSSLMPYKFQNNLQEKNLNGRSNNSPIKISKKYIDSNVQTDDIDEGLTYRTPVDRNLARFEEGMVDINQISRVIKDSNTIQFNKEQLEIITEEYSEQVSEISDDIMLRNVIPTKQSTEDVYKFLSPFYTKKEGQHMDMGNFSTMPTNDLKSSLNSRKGPYNMVTESKDHNYLETNNTERQNQYLTTKKINNTTLIETPRFFKLGLPMIDSRTNTPINDYIDLDDDIEIKVQVPKRSVSQLNK